MRKFFSFLFALILVFLSIFVSACSKTFDTYSFSAFNTEVFVTVRGKLSSGVKTQIKNSIISLDNEFSTTKQTSLIYSVNENQTANSLSADGKTVFELAKTYHSLTNEKFNPAIFPLTKLWQLSADTFSFSNELTIPTEIEIEEVSALCNFNDFTISESNKIEKLNEHGKLDFGGIIKGYGADKIHDILEENGFSEGYVRIGGSSLSILSIPSDLQIKHPRKSGEFIVSVKGNALTNTPLSTSGDYERYYEKDGEKYCHIIDNTTGAPIQTGISSASIFGVSGAFTDALSTAVCCFEFSDETSSPLTEFLTSITSKSEYSKMKFIIVHEPTKKIITNFSSSDLSILDQNYSIYDI